MLKRGAETTYETTYETKAVKPTLKPRRKLDSHSNPGFELRPQVGFSKSQRTIFNLVLAHPVAAQAQRTTGLNREGQRGGGGGGAWAKTMQNRFRGSTIPDPSTETTSGDTETTLKPH